MEIFQTYKEASEYAKKIAKVTGKTINLRPHEKGYFVDTPIKKEIHAGLFSDFKHFPYGFARSGDFSINGASLLEKNGNLLKNLQHGLQEPSSTKEKCYMEFLSGHRLANCDIEHIWQKYQNIIESRPINLFNGKGGEFAIDSDGATGTFSSIIPRGYMTKRHK